MMRKVLTLTITGILLLSTFSLLASVQTVFGSSAKDKNVIYHYDARYSECEWGPTGEDMFTDCPAESLVSPGPYPYQFSLNETLHVALRIRHFLWSHGGKTGENHLSIFVDGNSVLEAYSPYTNGSSANWFPGGNSINYVDLGNLSSGTHYITMTANEGDFYMVNWWEILLYQKQSPPSLTNVTSSKTVVGQGYKVRINVTTANVESYTESFNVTTYINATAIGTQTLTLTNGTFTTIVFTWNTADLAYGNYTISAYVWAILGEPKTTNNTATASAQIEVTILGDVNGDHVVNILDVAKIASIYGLRQGDPNFNPNCDLDGDGQITILDLVTCTSHYGQKWS
jgi:hypothetical protein